MNNDTMDRSRCDQDCCKHGQEQHAAQDKDCESKCGACPVDKGGCGCCGSHAHEEAQEHPLRTMVFLIVSGLAVLWSFLSGSESGLTLLPRIPLPAPLDDTAWLAVLLCGVPLVKEAVEGVIKRRDISSNVLVSIALIAAVAIGEVFAAGEVAFIMAIGELLEHRTVAKANRSLQQLVSLAPASARRRVGDGIEEVPVAQLRQGDIIVVKPGERLPVDGLVAAGRSAVDQAAITGESMPVDKAAGDTVYAGTMNVDGALDIRATAVGAASSLQKIIDLMRRAEAEHAPTARAADRWAKIIVPTALALSLITLVVSLLLQLPDAIIRAVTILVVFCPCALVLATPTAVMAAIGNASRHGVLIKSGAALEAAARVDTVALDKTGTLTVGKPEVAQILTFDGVTEDEVLSQAAAVEAMSTHPIAVAILRRAQAAGVALPSAANHRNLSGRGALAEVLGHTVAVGSLRLAREERAALTAEQMAQLESQEAMGRTLALVLRDGRVLGALALADTAKPGSAQAVAALKGMNLKLTLLSGDHEATARSIGASMGIEDVRAEMLPEDKANAIAGLQRQGRSVAMVGDGINDAPALATAASGIAMGALGADIAVEAAGIAVMTDDIGRVADVLALARRTLRRIYVNIIIAMSINFAAIVLAAFGEINPAIGAIVHNAGSLVVVASSAMLIRSGMKNNKGGQPA